MNRRLLSWTGVAALVVLSLGLGARPDREPSRDDRIEGIAAELRCPVCQGLSVADSDAETSRQIRADIEQRVTDGQTDAEIRQAYVDRYGEWILLRPTGRGVNAMVWVLPGLVGGAAALGLVVYRLRRRAWPRTAGEHDHEVVRRARQLVDEVGP